MSQEVRRARLVVAYDGAAFHGFAKNNDTPTVALLLDETLQRIARQPVNPVGAGRTDAGVHGWGQVVTCDLPTTIDLAGVQRRVNSMCAPELVVRSIEWAPSADFSARFDASWRHYRYTVLNTPTPHPFLAATSWHVTSPLDVRRMQLACDPFIGEHDFTSFCRQPKVSEGRRPKTMRRRVLIAKWTDLGEGVLRFDIRATAFCHQMVRSITGTMVDVGHGKRSPGEMMDILRGHDRALTGQVAPAHGLCLWEVGYPA